MRTLPNKSRPNQAQVPSGCLCAGAVLVRGSRLLSKKKLELAHMLHAEGVLCTDTNSAGNARSA